MGISASSQITDISLSVFRVELWKKRQEIAELLKLCLNNSLILTFVFQEHAICKLEKKGVSCDLPFPEKKIKIIKLLNFDIQYRFRFKSRNNDTQQTMKTT